MNVKSHAEVVRKRLEHSSNPDDYPTAEQMDAFEEMKKMALLGEMVFNAYNEEAPNPIYWLRKIADTAVQGIRKLWEWR